jgi:hypothetical protein
MSKKADHATSRAHTTAEAGQTHFLVLLSTFNGSEKSQPGPRGATIATATLTPGSLQAHVERSRCAAGDGVNFQASHGVSG